jgi:eukaryotic-like serine/threonine-protein kinase
VTPGTPHHFGPFRLDPESRVLTRDGTVVPLAPRTLDLLAILVASEGRLLTKDELLRVVWGDVNVEEASLAFQVSTLRKALGEFGTVWIETVPKHGYRFTAEVKPVTAPDTGPPPQRAQHVDGEPDGNTTTANGRPSSAVTGRPRWRRVPAHAPRWWLVAAVLALCAAAVAMIVLLDRQRATLESPPLRFDDALPATIRLDFLDGPQISPDGRLLVYTAEEGGHRRLFRTDLISQETTALDGTEGAMLPFWSPDSRSVGFFAGGELKEIPVTGGPARSWVSTGAAFGGGATWGPGIILFAPTQNGLIYRIASPGGQPVPLALPQPGAYLFPQLLPDGRTFLVWERSRRVLYAASLDRPGALETIETNVTWGGVRYEAGHLLFRRRTTLVARPFDPRRLAVSGPPRPLAANASMFSVSRTGTVVYRSEPPRLRQLTWFDRTGNRIGTVGDAGAIWGLSLAPSGRRAAIWRERGGNADIWTIDLASGVTERLTTDAAWDSDAAWSPNERTLAFTSDRSGNSAVYLKHLVDGKEELIADEPVLVVDTWTPDGKFVVARSMGRGIYLVPVTGDRTPQLLVETPYIEDELRISPEGQWVAFNSDESGRWEVYVAAFPDFTSKRQISAAGGVQPHWRGDGKELFFLGLDGSMMSAQGVLGADSTAAAPSVLFPTNIEPFPFIPQYAVTADGQQFLGLDAAERGPESFTFLLNFLQPGSAR